MPRYGRPSAISYAFGPGPITPAVKWIIIANVVMFVVRLAFPPVIDWLGLIPVDVIRHGWVWQLVTYMFLHADPLHILFNMLGIWMFGVELERMWGTPFFLKFFAVTGGGAAITTVLVSLLPFGFARFMYQIPTIGASGALYGILLAFALYFPTRPILMMMIFPIPAKYFVMIIGGMSLLFAISSVGGVAHFAHLGGLLFGYVYLQGGRGGLTAEIKYRYLKWKINRVRKKFDVYSGGRADDVNRRIH